MWEAIPVTGRGFSVPEADLAYSTALLQKQKQKIFNVGLGGF